MESGRALKELSVRLGNRLTQGGDQLGVELAADPVPPVHEVFNLGGLVEQGESVGKRNKNGLKLTLIRPNYYTSRDRTRSNVWGIFFRYPVRLLSLSYLVRSGSPRQFRL